MSVACRFSGVTGPGPRSQREQQPCVGLRENRVAFVRLELEGDAGARTDVCARGVGDLHVTGDHDDPRPFVHLVLGQHLVLVARHSVDRARHDAKTI